MHVPAAPHDMDAQALAGRIDHTLLSPAATRADIERLCAEAVAHGFKAVCVNPCRLPLAVELLRGHSTLPITVCGFPLGACAPEAKAREAALAVQAGAAEVDMVLNVGALKDGEADLVRADIAGVVAACAGVPVPVPVKVILETCLLTDAEKELACRLAVEAGAAFVKTSTGFSAGGATEADIALMRRVVDGLKPGPGERIGVKASGGIRTRADALRMLAAGADRIGASASVVIVTEPS